MLRLKEDIHVKRSISFSFSRCRFYFPAGCFWCYDGHSFARQLEKRDANRKRDDCNRALFYFARINRGERRETMVYMLPLRILKRGGERTFVTSQRPDRIYFTGT